MTEYLERPIAERYETEPPRYGMCSDGYTKRRGAPTSWMVRIEGDNIWRRLMCWQFSNAGTLFVRVKGRPFIVREHQLPESSKAKGSV